VSVAVPVDHDDGVADLVAQPLGRVGVQQRLPGARRPAVEVVRPQAGVAVGGDGVPDPTEVGDRPPGPVEQRQGGDHPPVGGRHVGEAPHRLERRRGNTRRRLGRVGRQHRHVDVDGRPGVRVGVALADGVAEDDRAHHEGDPEHHGQGGGGQATQVGAQVREDGAQHHASPVRRCSGAEASASVVTAETIKIGDADRTPAPGRPRRWPVAFPRRRGGLRSGSRGRPGPTPHEAVEVAKQLDLAALQPLALRPGQAGERIRELLAARHEHHRPRELAAGRTPPQAHTALEAGVGRRVETVRVRVNRTITRDAPPAVRGVDRADLRPRPSLPGTHRPSLPGTHRPPRPGTRRPGPPVRGRAARCVPHVPASWHTTAVPAAPNESPAATRAGSRSAGRPHRIGQ